MTLSIHSWEHRLLNWALEAIQHNNAHTHFEATSPDTLLEASYNHCRSITKNHSKTFFTASNLLGGEKRRSVQALYAFCRISDDIVDKIQRDDVRQQSLEAWKMQVIHRKASVFHPVVAAWHDTQSRFRIPVGYAEQLISGVERDFKQTSYADFAELAEYAYGVASTVGLMAMHIIGFIDKDAIPYAVRLGIALQLTNILRDVGEDFRNGRVYLPQDELESFGITRRDLASGIVTDKWREFMRFQIDRNRRLYQESLPGISLLEADGRFAIGAAAELYQGILGKIEENDYAVFNQRAHLSKYEKISRLPSIYWRTRNMNITRQVHTD